MVEDVIDIEARNAHIQAIELQILEMVLTESLAQIHITDLIIGTCTPIVQVSTHLGSIETEVELLLQRAYVNIL